jgi:hypothetical protein
MFSLCMNEEIRLNNGSPSEYIMNYITVEALKHAPIPSRGICALATSL